MFVRPENKGLYWLARYEGREFSVLFPASEPYVPNQAEGKSYDWIDCSLSRADSGFDGDADDGDIPGDSYTFVCTRDEFDAVYATFRNVSCSRPILMDYYLGLRGFLDLHTDFHMPVPAWLADVVQTPGTYTDFLLRVMRRFKQIGPQLPRYVVRDHEAELPIFTNDINRAMLEALRRGKTIIDLRSSTLEQQLTC